MATVVRTRAGPQPGHGHGDLCPWSILTKTDGKLTVLDWDDVGPVDGIWDLAQRVWLNADPHDDDVAAIG